MSNHIFPYLYNDNNPSFIPYSTTYTDQSLISISWNDILSKPSFSNICFTSSYNDLSNIPDLSVYASNSTVSNISNTLFQNSSNSNLNTSNSVITFTNTKASSIKTSQWISLNNDIYYNDGNVGIGSSAFGSDKLVVSGTINSDDYKIKGNNISNIFITSNVFINQSNNLFKTLSNQDYQSSLTPVVSSQWTSDSSSNIYFLNGNVGIGTSSFGTDKLIIEGSINTQELKLKGLNISNIFINSNNLNDRSNQVVNYTNSRFSSFSSNQFTTNGTNIYLNLTGNVGIGSSIPKEKLDINGNLNINGNILPNTCNSFNLGSSTFKWKDLYLSGTSIHMDNLNLNSSNNSLNIKDDITGDFKGLNISEIRLNSNNKISGIQIDTNGDLKINNKFLVSVANNNDYSNIVFSNVLNDTSNSLLNNINNNYNSLSIDNIPIGLSNRFITNDSYNRNITFTGTLTASNIISSNLSVIGDTSIFNTTIYQTEQLQVVNDTTATALVVKQLNTTQNLSEFYFNNNQLGLLISSNGNIGIGITNPTEKLDISGTINTIGFNLGGVNINTIITSNDSYTSNILFNNVSNNNFQTSNANIQYSSNSSNSLYVNKQNILTASTVLLGDGGSITNINFDNLANKPNLSSYTTTTALSTTSNNLYSNISNLDFSSSNNTFTYSSNRISNIILNNYQWTSNGNDVYLNMIGNAGIGSTIPSEKLDVSGNINTSELLIKKTNISNVFITSNVFENRSNNSYLNLSNQDFISSNNCILYTNAKTTNLSIGGGGGSAVASYWIASGSSNIYVMSNVGIGTTNPQSKLDVLGDINYTGNLRINNTIIPFSTTSNTNIIATNAFFSNVNNSYGYYMFLTSGTITFPQATNCDLLLIGAGGNGGLIGGGGGGGAGELIYYPNYPFTIGTSNIQIGYSSFNTNSRITKISNNNVDYVVAKGGGDGGYGYTISITGTSNSINTATDNANYRYALFNSNGTFTTNASITCDILIVGGGGGGGSRHGGGGGAGGLIYLTNQTLNAGNYSITIGNGGGAGAVGQNTTFGSFIAYGGGLGGSWDTGAGGAGGSGGGSGSYEGTIGGTGVTGQGFNGGNVSSSSTYKHGGGGGAGGAGVSGTSTKSGDGGIGIQINITGTNTYYAGGGGGGSHNSDNGSTNSNMGSVGGLGGGGAGGTPTKVSNGVNGVANTGGGGGGASVPSGGGSSGGTGGSGIVIIRYNFTNIKANPTISANGSGGGSFLNYNNQSLVTSNKWNSSYSYVSSGLNGTATQGGSGGSSPITKESITGTAQIIAVGGAGATASSVASSVSTYGSGGNAGVSSGGSGASGVIIIRLVKEIRNFNLGKNYLLSRGVYNYPTLTINPFIWYKFDDATNLGRDDMNIHNLVNNNSVSINLNDFIRGSGSGSFNGTNQFLSKDSAFNLNSQSFSISLWVKRTANNRDDYFIELGTGYSANTTITCGYRSTNVITLANWTDDLNSVAYASDAGNWVHLCFTYLTGTKRARIYRNGIRIGEKNFGSEFSTNNNIRIGKLNTSYFQGLLDDLRIYQVELTSNQVQELYEGSRINLINYGNTFSRGLVHINSMIDNQSLVSYYNLSSNSGLSNIVFSSIGSNFNNPFLMISNINQNLNSNNNSLNLLSYTNNACNSILLSSEFNIGTGQITMSGNNSNMMIMNSNIINVSNYLDIKGRSGSTVQGGAYITTTTGVVTETYNTALVNYSLRTSSNIICGKNSYALSDIRIKGDLLEMGEDEMGKFLGLRSKRYRMVEDGGNGSNVYGFIAQEVKEDIPEAIELMERYVPDIFKLVKIDMNRIVMEEEDMGRVFKGDKIRIYTKEEEYEVEIEDVDEERNEIIINREIKDEDIFIYGRKVNDFQVIDKSYIYTLNVFATQRIGKILRELEEKACKLLPA